ncbi:hypothetical protein ACSBR1_009118 [Camellia fascicularis]
MESMPKPSMESDDKLHIVMLPWAKNSPKTQSPPPIFPMTRSNLKMAYDQLQQPMTQLLADMAPDWVIYDFAPYWLGPVAAKLGISSVFFRIFIAATLCFVGPIPVLKGEDDRTTPKDFTVTPKWIPFKSNIACYRLFEIKSIFDDVASVDDENIPGTYRLGAGIEACDVLAVRSSYKFEPEWLKLLQQIHQKPIIPIGLLPTTAYDSSDNGEVWTEIKEWLDKQSKRSVVYVAFGSEAKPSQAELTEIAFGLELSELPFFWVLRNRLGVADTEVRTNNQTGAPNFSSGLIGKDNAIARHGIHGLYRLFSKSVPGSQLYNGKNTIYLMQSRASSPFQGVMYDYIRLEGPK